MYCILNRINCSLSCHKLLTPEKFILRRTSFLEKVRPKPIILDKRNHKLIYEFKSIVLPAAFLKIKFTFPVISVVLISASAYLKQTEWIKAIGIASVLQLLLILVVLKVTKNLIGRIYVNKKGDIENVIISSIDSSGRRVDECYSSDLFHLSEPMEANFFGLAQVKVKGGKKTYKMFPKEGTIHDIKAMRKIFENIKLFLRK